MNLKNAAFLAFIGTLIALVFQTFDFVNGALALGQGIVPLVQVLRSAAYFVAGLTVTIFFYVFHRSQS